MVLKKVPKKGTEDIDINWPMIKAQEFMNRCNELNYGRKIEVWKQSKQLNIKEIKVTVLRPPPRI